MVLIKFSPWYGLGRSLLAISTFSTLLINQTNHLFPAMKGNPAFVGADSPLAKLGIFYLFGSEHVDFARWVSLLLLAPSVVGFLPRYFGIFHWWVAFSVSNNVVVTEGGDQIASILALFLIPACLSDNRVWHWSSLKSELSPLIQIFGDTLTAWLCRIQVSLIYAHACMGKVATEEWSNGTAVYYWATHPSIGASGPILSLLKNLFKCDWVATGVTWSILFIEFILAAAIFSDEKFKKKIILLGISLHFGIILIHGLLGFSLVMFAALILYLLAFSPHKVRNNSEDELQLTLVTPVAACEAIRAPSL